MLHGHDRHSLPPCALPLAPPLPPYGPNQFRAHVDFVERPRQLLILGGREEGDDEAGKEGNTMQMED